MSISGQVQAEPVGVDHTVDKNPTWLGGRGGFDDDAPRQHPS